MTEEQIKQNAEEYANKVNSFAEDESVYFAAKAGYVSGAHSRDEEIMELKEKLQHRQDLINVLIDELEKARNHWTSVEERLPEEEDNPDEYNAPHRERSSNNVIITDGTIINRGYYSYARMRWEWNMKKIRVTHWMPIPDIH